MKYGKKSLEMCELIFHTWSWEDLTLTSIPLRQFKFQHFLPSIIEVEAFMNLLSYQKFTDSE